MKKFFLFPVFICSFSLIFADIYKEESKKIAADKRRVAEVEKKLSTDEKDCENPSGKDLDRSVVTELRIYCDARESAKSRIPAIKSMLTEYEKAFNDYLEKCKKIDSDEKFSECESLDRKIASSAEVLNDEKEKFNSDIDTMDNAAARAKELNERSGEAGREDFKRTVSSSLNAKKELVTTMQKGLEEDSKVFKNSKSKLSQSIKNGSAESAAKGNVFMEGLNKILLQNSTLRQLCASMLKTIDEAKNVCVSKTDMEKCRTSVKA